MKKDESTKRKERRSRKAERTVSNNTVNTVMTSADCTENHRDCALNTHGITETAHEIHRITETAH